MTQEKVKNLLGEPKAIGTSALESHKVWRHGYVTKEGYVFGEQKDFQEMGIRYGGWKRSKKWRFANGICSYYGQMKEL